MAMWPISPTPGRSPAAAAGDAGSLGVHSVCCEDAGITHSLIVAIVVLLYQHESAGLKLFHVGEALLVIAAGLTIWSGLDYLRAAWPSLREEEKAARDSAVKK